MKNLLFIWIPKTAGTSLYSVLKNKYDMPCYTEKYGTFQNSGSVTFGHADHKLLLKENIISHHYWNSAFKFAVVRNPFSRFISLYYDYKRTGRIHPNMSPIQFANLLRNVTRKPGLFNAIDFSMCASQVDWLTPDTQIFSIETINVLLELLEINELPKLNKSNKKSWTDHYDTELTQLVQEIYNDDFSILNY